MVIPFVLDVDPVSRSLRYRHMGGPHCWVTDGCLSLCQETVSPLSSFSQQTFRLVTLGPRAGTPGAEIKAGPPVDWFHLSLSPPYSFSLCPPPLSPSHSSCLDFYPRLLVL